MATVWLSWVNGSWANTPEMAGQTTALLIAFLGLSCFFPLKCPVWLKQSYIGCGIVLFLLAIAKGLNFELFLYLYLAKSCFLLTRKQALITATIATITINLIPTREQSVLLQFEWIWNRNLTHSPHSDVVLDISTGYFIPAILTMMFCFAIITEQKSRSRAEGLAQEVEILIATLERQRIARDIHDSLGHSLTTLNIHLAVAKKWYQRDSDKTLDALNTAKLLADQCIEEVRQTLQTIRQSNFDLNQALVALLEKTKQNLSLQMHWDINLPQLPLQISHHIYCILREGLINIQKHAHASSVYVRAVATPDGIVLELEDDGQGFDPQVQYAGLGLRGMQERVQLLRGQFALHTAPGQGVKIQVMVLLP